MIVVTIDYRMNQFDILISYWYENNESMIQIFYILMLWLIVHPSLFGLSLASIFKNLGGLIGLGPRMLN